MNIDYENLKLLNQPFYQEYVEGLKKVLDSGWFILGNNPLPNLTLMQWSDPLNSQRRIKVC